MSEITQTLALDAEDTMPEGAAREWVRLPQLSKETTIPLSWLYEKSRFDQLPGQNRAGKYVIIHRPTFLEALRRGDLAKKEAAR